MIDIYIYMERNADFVIAGNMQLNTRYWSGVKKIANNPNNR